jgi:hypothetical protein
MIIELDGYFHQVLLTGKKCSKQQLKQKYLETKKLTRDIEDLPSLFCRLHKFEELSHYGHIKVDYVIDTDTDRIYSPSF